MNFHSGFHFSETYYSPVFCLMFKALVFWWKWRSKTASHSRLWDQNMIVFYLVSLLIRT